MITGGVIDGRSDLYSFGVLAYEMFTGQVPFSADTPVAILMKHVQEPLPLPPRDSVPDGLIGQLLYPFRRNASKVDSPL